MTVCYLEVDDEITGAIKRLRAIADGEALLVIPPGSRIATSRINFRLLVREAAERRLNVAAVSDEPGVRALAISAGLPAYDSIGAAQAALATFRDQDRRLAERLGKPGGDTAVLRVPSAVAAGHAAGPGAGQGAAPTEFGDSGVLPAPAARRRRRASRPALLPLLVLALIVVLVIGVGYGAYVLLPTATITVHPTAAQVTLPTYTVTADPNVAVADPDARVVGAQRLTLPISVSDSFAATGAEVNLTSAHGTVTFSSTNTLNQVPVARGTVVSTVDGIEFTTTDATIIPLADFSTGTAGTIDVHIKASVAGPHGNVPAGAITKLPPELAAQLVTVSNTDPTTGGQRSEQTVVAQDDYDAALAALTARLPAAAAAAAAIPANVPRGLTAYPATATVGDALPDPAAADVVGSAAETFDLSLAASLTIVAVNEAQVDDLGASRLQSSLSSDQQVVSNSMTVTHGPGSVVGQTIVFQVTASVTVYAAPSAAQLVQAVRGKSVAEARQALAPYGSADIVMWPDFVDHLPDQAARISLAVVPPSFNP